MSTSNIVSIDNCITCQKSKWVLVTTEPSQFCSVCKEDANATDTLIDENRKLKTDVEVLSQEIVVLRTTLEEIKTLALQGITEHQTDM